MEGKIRLSGGENVCRVDRDVCRVHREKPDRRKRPPPVAGRLFVGIGMGSPLE